MNEVLKIENLHKFYLVPNGEKLHVLKGINLSIKGGTSVGIFGVCGSGKSTLLHLLGSLDTPTKGKIYYNSTLLNQFNDEQLSELRNSHFGFILQFHYLIGELTVLENTFLPFFIKTDKKAKKLYYDSIVTEFYANLHSKNYDAAALLLETYSKKFPALKSRKSDILAAKTGDSIKKGDFTKARELNNQSNTNKNKKIKFEGVLS